MTRQNVLLTGGTGFVGKAVLARLVDQPLYDRIYLLVRTRRHQAPSERIVEIISRMFPPGRVAALNERIIPIAGDLTEPELGLSQDDRAMIKSDCHQILHVGASTDFGSPLEESRLYNVEGTRRVLELACSLRESGVLKRFDYVSTAYVAGCKPGTVNEDDLARDQEFSNNYERSKYEAEVLVRAYAKRLPTAIYRPSIIVGDSKNGYTPHFKVLYWPLLLLSKRDLLPFFACNQSAFLDVVPVDFVADGMVALMQKTTTVGGTFHLTAGYGNELRIRQLLKDAYKLAGIAKRTVVPFWTLNAVWKSPLRHLFSDAFWEACEIARPYFVYLRGPKLRFKADKTHALLKSAGVEAPLWNDYKREVLGFCVSSRWGRKLPMPEYVYYLPMSGRKEAVRGDAQRSVARPLGIKLA